MAKDPVCGMQIDEEKPAETSEYQGRTYYFCSPGCKATFDREPDKFIEESIGHSGNHAQ